MRRLFVGILIASCANAGANDCVILLHGLARASASMDKLDDELTRQGYSVMNHPYPSRHKKIQQLASSEIPLALDKCTAKGEVHFVTHSLGAIVLRQYLNDYSIERLGRTVMLAQPNQGSQVVDKLKGIPGFKLINMRNDTVIKQVIFS
ncbi:hypothetical protein OOT55_17580 [Marinimicrobium sp. C6131]|uniref:esterase/lipase family protein n=1 Tax=Marinimicrobium sp. C6131 TaxID=3022676 RepID=UPI00223CF7F3|nr:hypothetical protein [Marinimicrobium sp. C6131]UZJ44446.1 hypothetical protein OOT55_17580 [Marinimicrobium sp. C6131]